MSLIVSLILGTLAQDRDWDPPKTWVFLVGILEWKDSKSFGSFPKEGRRDAELAEFFRSQGVPRGQVVFLKDDEGTREKIAKSLAEFLSKTREGDFLFLYYAGHGGKDKNGTAYFMPYDAGGEYEKSAWSIPSIFDAIEKGFRGNRAFLSADCCYSGSLGVEAAKRKTSLAYACLSSSQASTVSTGNWTFTECLLAGLRGMPAVDANGDGTVALDELARYSEAEMAFADEQLSSFATTGRFDAGMKLAAASKRAHARLGERVEVKWRASEDAEWEWYKCRILGWGQRGFKIHYLGWEDKYDEWVGEDRMRAPQYRHFRKGTPVEVEWQGKWYPAAVLDCKLGLHFIHYDGHEDFWDEWVSSKRIRTK